MTILSQDYPSPPYLLGKVLVFMEIREGVGSNALNPLRLKSKPLE
jgi:hypothetical protein